MAELILIIALQYGLPPNFVLAIAYTENTTLSPTATNRNRNGTYDVGVMQLNTAYHGYCYDVEKNIRRACDFIRSLRQRGLGWYNVAVAYNCGYGAYKAGNYKHDYGRKVWAKWHELGRDDR